MRRKMLFAARAALIGAVAGTSSMGFAAAFTANNLVVLRVGDGSAALGSTLAAPVFLDEYTTAGSLVQSIAIPTTATLPSHAVTLHGAETAVGALNLSADGQYLTFAGYDAPVGTANLTSTTPSTNPRVIVRVDASGTIDTTTTITDGFGRIAGASSTDGTKFWTSGNTSGGNTGGIRYSASLGASTTTLVCGTPNNLLMTRLIAGQLHTSVSFGSTIGVARVGTGLPTTTGQTITLLNGFPTSGTHAPRCYYFTDASTIYMTDTGTTANGGGVQKWTLSSGTWTQAGSPFPYASPTTSNGLCGLTGTFSGANVTLYATSVEASANSIVKWASTNSGASGTISTLATTSTNMALRGIAFTPGSTLPLELPVTLDAFQID